MSLSARASPRDRVPTPRQRESKPRRSTLSCKWQEIADSCPEYEAAGRWDVLVQSFQHVGYHKNEGLTAKQFMAYRRAFSNAFERLRRKRELVEKAEGDIMRFHPERRLRDQAQLDEARKIIRSYRIWMEKMCNDGLVFLEFSELRKATGKDYPSWERRLAILRLVCKLLGYLWEIAVLPKTREVRCAECEKRYEAVFFLAQQILKPAHPILLGLAQDYAKWAIQLGDVSRLFEAEHLLKTVDAKATMQLQRMVRSEWCEAETPNVVRALLHDIEVTMDKTNPKEREEGEEAEKEEDEEERQSCPASGKFAQASSQHLTSFTPVGKADCEESDELEGTVGVLIPDCEVVLETPSAEGQLESCKGDVSIPSGGESTSWSNHHTAIMTSTTDAVHDQPTLVLTDPDDHTPQSIIGFYFLGDRPAAAQVLQAAAYDEGDGNVDSDTVKAVFNVGLEARPGHKRSVSF